jgi:hypothetical protein
LKENAPVVFLVPQDKYTTTDLKLQAFCKFILVKPATSRMIERHLGLTCDEVTMYKAKLFRSGQLVNLKKRPCKLTGRVMLYMTTNPKLVGKAPKWTPKMRRRSSSLDDTIAHTSCKPYNRFNK